MKQRNITIKLFIITAVFLALFVGGLLLFQVQFFGKYYTEERKSEFTRAVDSLISQLDGLNVSEDDILSKFEKYKSENNINPILFPLDDNEEINTDNIKEYFVNSITINSSSEINQIAMEMLSDLSKGQRFSEKFIQVIKPKNFEQQYLIGEKNITLNNTHYMLLIVSTLQPVDEAVSMLNSSFFFVFIIAIILSLALALLISRLIARPLIREIQREKELDRMRCEFIANASHELKTPLSIICGYTESLLDNMVSGAEIKEYESIIFDETQKMGKLVRDMLEISMLQNKAVIQNLVEFNLNYLIDKILQVYARQMREKQIIIQKDDFLKRDVFADEVQVETAIRNIISNAIFHTPKEGKIYIRLKDTGHTACIEIENEGEHIPDEMLSSIWDTFVRVDKAHNRQDGRYGLGLSIVKNIVEKHGGKYGVYNAEQGVCFWITLPCSNNIHE